MKPAFSFPGSAAGAAALKYGQFSVLLFVVLVFFHACVLFFAYVLSIRLAFPPYVYIILYTHATHIINIRNSTCVCVSTCLPAHLSRPYMQPVISFSICFALASVQLILVHIRILRVRLCDSRNNQMCIMCQQEASPASLLPFAAMVDDQVLLHLDISAMFLAHLQAKQSDKHVFMIWIPNYDIYNGYITCMAGR